MRRSLCACRTIGQFPGREQIGGLVRELHVGSEARLGLQHRSGHRTITHALLHRRISDRSTVGSMDASRSAMPVARLRAPKAAIFASNTSGLPISRIAEVLENPRRAATTHFWNPAHLMPLVEIVKGERTSDETVARLRSLLDGAGKQTVVVLKDVPGQLGNRLLHALFREAFHIVQEGIASVEDVDLAIKTGPGLRFPAYGLLEHADMIGLDMQLAIDSYLFAELCNLAEAPALLEELVARGDLGARTGRGLYDWSGKDADAVRARRDRFIIDRLKERAMR